MNSGQRRNSMMKVRIGLWYVLLGGLYACMCGCTSSRQVKESRWNSHKIVVDGNNNDWELPYSCSSKEHKLQYDIANDSLALYLTLKTSNDVTAYKISKAGLYIYIDTAGGRSEQMQLMCLVVDAKAGKNDKSDLFPGNSMMHMSNDTLHMRPGIQATNSDSLMVSQVFVSGFTRCNGAYTGKLKSKCQLQVAVTINDFGEMVWELAIPYDMPGIGIAAVKEVSICLAMNALQEGDRPLTAMIAPVPAMRRPPVGGGGRGMSKPGSGELPPNAGREDPENSDVQLNNQARIDDLDRLTKEIHIWHRVKLTCGTGRLK